MCLDYCFSKISLTSLCEVDYRRQGDFCCGLVVMETPIVNTKERRRWRHLGNVLEIDKI